MKTWTKLFEEYMELVKSNSLQRSFSPEDSERYWELEFMFGKVTESLDFLCPRK